MEIQSVSMCHHTQNVFSQMEESGTQSREPFLGMAVTINYFSDRLAATIVGIKGKSVSIRHNKVTTLDYYAGKYEIHEELEGGEQTFTKRKNGRWVAEGQNLKNGLGISLGLHDHWIDPNF